MLPIVISSSPELTPSHGTTYAMSMVVLSSDDDTLPPSKPKTLFHKQVVEIISSDDSKDDSTIQNIQRSRAERAAILNLPEEELLVGIVKEKKDEQDITKSKADQKSFKVKQAKDLIKETQRNIKRVNHKRDKNTTAREMMVEISRDLMDRNGEELVSLLQEIDVECVYTLNPIPCSILFKRKVDRTWDDDNVCWVPCSITLKREAFVILQMDAFEFADTVKQGLDSYHQRLKSTFPQFKLIYLIEDLDGYYSEKKNQLNRQMRENMAGEPSGRLSKKAKERNKLLDMLPSQEIIEEQLLWLQFQAEGDTFIHHCKKDDTAAWIKTFVIEIGHIPEWKSQNEESFDVQFGDKIKSGKTFIDTWRKMLECIPFVTEAKALAITEKYPTFNSLYSTYLSLSQKDGERLLTGISLGSTASKRVYDAFMSKATQSNFLSH